MHADPLILHSLLLTLLSRPLFLYCPNSLITMHLEMGSFILHAGQKNHWKILLRMAPKSISRGGEEQDSGRVLYLYLSTLQEHTLINALPHMTPWHCRRLACCWVFLAHTSFYTYFFANLLAQLFTYLKARCYVVATPRRFLLPETTSNPLIWRLPQLHNSSSTVTYWGDQLRSCCHRVQIKPYEIFGFCKVDFLKLCIGAPLVWCGVLWQYLYVCTAQTSNGAALVTQLCSSVRAI